MKIEIGVKAIIVVADPNYIDIEKKVEDRFLRTGDFIRQTLKDTFGFSEENISHIVCKNLESSPKKLHDFLEDTFLENPGKDFCIFYTGHGNADGWSIDGTLDQILAYEDLRLVFAQHNKRLIFINSCCHAGAAEISLQNHSGESLLLAAMPGEISGLAFGFLPGIFECWGRGDMFDPESARISDNYAPVIFGNKDLQKLIIKLRKR